MFSFRRLAPNAAPPPELPPWSSTGPSPGPHGDEALLRAAAATATPALAMCLVNMTRFAEAPCPAAAQRIVCQLDCAAQDETGDASMRAMCALLARIWLRDFSLAP